jgi:SAM-dependent methyltransferase
VKSSVIYSNQFFARQVDGSARSAAVVVPLVLSLLPVRSVIDVGCGVGPWAAEFLANGVLDVWGVDGDYVDRSQLLIPRERFLAQDLTKPLVVAREFDLAVCLEVAEHLPASRASGLVADLTNMAPCVLFSAAIPGPTGTHHINSQYLPYWVDLFQARRYEAVDAIRPRIWGNVSVEWFYQQDTVVFAAQNHSLLERGFPKPQTMVHQQLYEQVLRMRPSLGTLARSFPGAVSRSIRYHLTRIDGKRFAERSCTMF